ncbi:MAG: hypothetical protein DRJ40_10240 [Thermoprotei archaeon]|nr:MAG: hypothetical protein DRJ40_10240 [Thermoprotei archaeon]
MTQVLRVLITGTPGTGKTTVAKKLSQVLNAEYIDVGSFCLSHNLCVEYDARRDTYVIDLERARSELREYLAELSKVVVDTHIPSVMPPDLVTHIFVLRLHPLELVKRLRARYSSKEEKIAENVLAEYIGVIANEARSWFSSEKVFEINVTGLDVDTICDIVLGIVRGGIDPSPYRQQIDWLLDESEELTQLIMECERILGRSSSNTLSEEVSPQ